jgi:hypothetical protein
MATSSAASVTMTPAAKAALDLHFHGQDKPIIRIFLSFLDESGPRLELAPDPPTPADTHCHVDGWTFVISTLLLDQAAPLTIDIGPKGFQIASSLDFSESGGGCGGSCDDHHHH